MKKPITLVILILVGCSNTSLVDNWKSLDIASFNANKVLIVGMTLNNDVRIDFEIQMKKEFIIGIGT